MWLVITTIVIFGGIAFCLGYGRGKAVANKKNRTSWSGLLALMEPKSNTSVEEMATALAKIRMDPIERFVVNAAFLAASYRKTHT